MVLMLVAILLFSVWYIVDEGSFSFNFEPADVSSYARDSFLFYSSSMKVKLDFETAWKNFYWF